MAPLGLRPPTSTNVLGVIMGGGEGRRLFPLTKERAKPAVPIAGKYRLVDIPISNCINSNIRHIYIDAVQLRLAPPAYPPELRLRPVFPRIHRSSRGPTDLGWVRL